MSIAQRIYLESTVWYQLVNYRDSGFKERAQQMIEQIEREDYTICISNIVLEELAYNRPKYRKRVEELVDRHKPIVLVQSESSEDLAMAYIENAFKERPRHEVIVDALHASIATTSNIAYMATYNYRNLLNVKTLEHMNGVNLLAGYHLSLAAYPPFMFLELWDYEGDMGSVHKAVWEIKKKLGKRLEEALYRKRLHHREEVHTSTVKRATKLGLRVIHSHRSDS
ncbi:MAG: PIN domain-containing protein [Chitinivibrionales bacterium]|nr:PIN domain-containing protein [Chitinivibrionales bacterium]MBD3358558.1 PIN domain-containing protein [Chitinivibrionales bacterium]